MPRNNSNLTFKQIRDLFFPIGSIKIQLDNTNPSTLIGGEWELIENDTYICSGTSASISGSNNRTLSVDNLPKHTHIINDDGEGTFGYTTLWRDGGQGTPFHTGYFNYEDVNDVTIGYGATGMDMMKIKLSNHKHGGATGDGSFSNKAIDIQPKHLSCYIFKRIS